MDFKFPEKKYINKMYNKLKKMYEKDFYDFFKKIKQRIFYIIGNTIESVVVIHPDERAIDIFVGDRGLITCHNMFLGDFVGINQYGYCQYSILEMDKEDIANSYMSKQFKQYRFYNYDDKTVVYLSALPGQSSFICNEEETLQINEIMDLMFEIMMFYENGYELPNETDEDMVGVFKFDEDTMEYDSIFKKLEDFNFINDITVNKYKNKKYIEKLSQLEIKSGTLHLGIAYSNNVHDIYEYSNDVNIGLNPIYLLAYTEDFFEYSSYSSLYKIGAKNLKEQLIKLLSKTGLYDTIVTSNPYIYSILVKNLAELGIEVLIDEDDIFIKSGLFFISVANENKYCYEDYNKMYDMVKENYAFFVEQLLDAEFQLNDLIVSEDDEYEEEIDEEIDEEMYKESDSSEVC